MASFARRALPIGNAAQRILRASAPLRWLAHQQQPTFDCRLSHSFILRSLLAIAVASLGLTYGRRGHQVTSPRTCAQAAGPSRRPATAGSSAASCCAQPR
jgi:hypothetical protein